MVHRLWEIIFIIVAISSVFMYAGTLKAQYVQDGLISYWSFNEADIDGEIIKDVMGKNNGIIKGTPEIVEGKVGDAMLFNMNKGNVALRGDHIDVGGEINSKILKGFTVEGWFKFAQKVPGIVHVLMCAREGAWAISKGVSYLYSNGYQQEGFTMYFRLHHAGGPCNLAYKLFEPEVGEWYHYTATYDGKEVKFYVNSESVTTLPCAEGVEETAETLKIGHSKMFGNQWGFPGAIDEVRIYSRALSDAEVKKNFASTGAAVEYSIKKLSITWGEIKVSW